MTDPAHRGLPFAKRIAEGESSDSFPRPFRESRADDLLRELAEENPPLRPLLKDKNIHALLRGVFGNSDYLASIARRDSAALLWCLATDPDAALINLRAAARKASEAESMESAMRDLREAKKRMALLAALADISGLWSLTETMRALSAFAETTLEGALQWLLREAAREGALKSHDPEKSGVAIIAMGKLGAHELNYSSDLDIVAFYDPAAPALSAETKAERFYPRLARQLASMMQETTEAGYVFRMDLRLRPDPGATAAAVSIPAAIDYYQNLGQHWERAAYIRARPVAGSIRAGRDFLRDLRPFIWRKYLDYAVIEDMTAMKRQVEGVAAGSASALAGLDIKRAPGGIREIEFFVQTQQLILGGRDESLRREGLRVMLGRLAVREWISRDAARDMADAYMFLRKLEHRLQMMEDAQTHALPRTEEGMENVARFMNYPDIEAFTRELERRRGVVSAHYGELFARSPSLGSEARALIFTGSQEDPATMETLASMGFARPRDIIRIAQGWHAGRVPATRSPRSRERLTRLMPNLLEGLARTSEPDRAFLVFDQFLARLPTAGQLFSLFEGQPALLRLVCDICGTAPRLADQLGRHPQMIEALLTPSDAKTRESLRKALWRDSRGMSSFEERLMSAQRFAREERFRIGTEILHGGGRHRDTGAAYADCAETVIALLREAVTEEHRERHGDLAGSELAVLAMGRLGTRSMSDASDLDLVFLYRNPEREEDLGRASSWHGRWAQSFVAALSAPTAAGNLYEVDMRLRPSGRAGPVALELERFISYQRDEARIWEHMALSSARVVSGSGALRERIDRAIREVLIQRREAHEVARHILWLRKRIAASYPAESVWDLRFARGGIRDADFLRQYILLLYGREHGGLLDLAPEDCLREAAELGILSGRGLEALRAAHILYENLTQLLCLCVEGNLRPETAPISLRSLIASAAGVEGFARTEALLARRQREVYDFFTSVIGEY